MAKGKKTGGKDFLPSNTASPGRPKTDQEIKALQNYTKSELNRAFHSLLHGNSSETFRIKHDPEATILEIGIAKVLESFALYGDVNKFNALAAHCGLTVPKTLEPIKIEDEPQNRMSAEELTQVVLFIRKLKAERDSQEKLVSGTEQLE